MNTRTISAFFGVVLAACMARAQGASGGLVETALPTSRTTPTNQTFSIMTFNVRHCEGMDGKIDIARTAAAIADASPDFACLQELDVRTARSGGVDQPVELARLTGMHPTFAKAIDYKGGEYGVAILSRKPPLAVSTRPLPGKEARVLLVCDFGDFAVATSHLSVGNAAERVASIPPIQEAFAALGKPVFFTGDWNAKPDSRVLADIRGFMSVVSPTKGVRTYHGSPAAGPDGKLKDVCIDYVAVDTAHAGVFAAKSPRVVEDRATSDHAPVVVEITRR